MSHVLTRHHEVLAALGGFVTEQTRLHEARQDLWFPSEILPETPQTFTVPAEVKVLLVLNTLTEEGLPSFHRLLATHLGESSPMVSWTDLWTAEEDRHGTVLRDFLLRVVGLNMAEVERMQYAYQRQGFRPDWQLDPYQLIAYTILQEWATQISHQNVSKILKGDEPVLEVILGKIAKEEAKHLAFYRSVFAKILEQDPNDALVALSRVMRGFAMPGKNIPGFADLSAVSDHAKMFTSQDYCAILTGTSKFLGLTELDGLDDAGKRARDQILALPARLDRVSARRAQFTMPKFPFLQT